MDDRLIGRGAFLAVLGAGAAGIFFARSVTDGVSRLIPTSLSAIVPSSGWRIYTIADEMPNIDPAAYRLEITGLSRPATFTLDELKALPRTDQVSDFHCVTGWSVDNVRWAGVRLSDLLDHVGDSEAGALRFVSAERPYDDWLTREQALLPDVMLAYEMDGVPIPRPHGAPVRLVMPQMYGYKSVKWVQRIELAATAEEGYWEQRGYDSDAWVGRSN
jgi:DMSO/TMAO reductase YedYZ molybdopterin-dependent catalytic subunit